MSAPTLRRNDVDWLRVFAVYMLFIFHTAMVFNPAPFYHIRNADLSLVMLIAADFISLWHMPLFFLLAGTAIAGWCFVVALLGAARFCVGMKPRRARPAAARLARQAAAVLAVALAIASVARAAAETTPVGRWYAEGGAAQVEISPCGDGLCGRVVWLRAPFDEYGCTLRDRFNGDARLRERSVLGLEILRGLQPVAGEKRVWEHGAIYDPGSGRTYTCRLTLVDDDRVELRGYYGIPMLGRTTSWIRVGAEEGVCRAVRSPSS